MPWKYTNFYEVAASMEEGEQIKANDELELHFGWWEEYYKSLRDTVTKYPDQIVVIPTISAVQRMLEADGIPYTLVIPKKELKKEYEKRYIARGNTEEFLDVFIGCWDSWMEVLGQNNANYIIELGEGEYLSDKIIDISRSHNNIIPYSDKQSYIYKSYFQGK